jgi:hypothetical protein
MRKSLQSTTKHCAIPMQCLSLLVANTSPYRYETLVTVGATVLEGHNEALQPPLDSNALAVMNPVG